MYFKYRMDGVDEKTRSTKVLSTWRADRVIKEQKSKENLTQF